MENEQEPPYHQQSKEQSPQGGAGEGSRQVITVHKEEPEGSLPTATHSSWLSEGDPYTRRDLESLSRGKLSKGPRTWGLREAFGNNIALFCQMPAETLQEEACEWLSINWG